MSDEDALATLHRALDLGVNFFDTQQLASGVFFIVVVLIQACLTRKQRLWRSKKMHPSETPASEKETTVESYHRMRKQRLLKEDGRYIIFYDFEEQGESSQKEGDEG